MNSRMLEIFPGSEGLAEAAADAIEAALQGALDSDPLRGRWYDVPDVDPVALRLGFERGTGVVELRVVPTGFGADAVVERLRVLCAVMQAWSLVAGV